MEKAAAAEANKKEANKAKETAAKNADAAAAAAALAGTTIVPPVSKPAVVDEENLDGPDEQSEASGVGEGHRFDNLIKSMLARLELNGSLAPL